VVAKEAFKSPVNPHIEGRGFDYPYMQIFEICIPHLIPHISRKGGMGHNFDRCIR